MLFILSRMPSRDRLHGKPVPKRPSAQQHESIRALAAGASVPAPPARPVAGECCDRGCDPCVWDYYVRGLERWAARHGLAARVEQLMGD
jgi:hypothetical protein